MSARAGSALETVERAVADALSDVAGRIWVAFSGGMDSTVLLHATARVLANRERLCAVHVDHGIAAQSSAWATHCQREVNALGVAIRHASVQVAPGSNLEARARTKRYGVFESVLADGDVLLLAHHADDQLETILLRLLRGTDTGRLAMPAVRALGRGRLKRPLLSLPRAVLEATARILDVGWITDPSNAFTTQDRNYLRHVVMPHLVGRWPDAATRAARAAERAAIDAVLADALIDARLPAPGDDLPRALLSDDAMAARVLRRWLVGQGMTDVRERLIDEVLRQLGAGGAVGVEVAVGTWVRGDDRYLHVISED